MYAKRETWGNPEVVSGMTGSGCELHLTIQLCRALCMSPATRLWDSMNVLDSHQVDVAPIWTCKSRDEEAHKCEGGGARSLRLHPAERAPVLQRSFYICSVAESVLEREENHVFPNDSEMHLHLRPHSSLLEWDRDKIEPRLSEWDRRRETGKRRTESESVITVNSST